MGAEEGRNIRSDSQRKQRAPIRTDRHRQYGATFCGIAYFDLQGREVYGLRYRICCLIYNSFTVGDCWCKFELLLNYMYLSILLIRYSIWPVNKRVIMWDKVISDVQITLDKTKQSQITQFYCSWRRLHSRAKVDVLWIQMIWTCDTKQYILQYILTIS